MADYTGSRNNHRLNSVIERFIDIWDGTAIGMEAKNMYENGTSYETICEKINLYFAEYEED